MSGDRWFCWWLLGVVYLRLLSVSVIICVWLSCLGRTVDALAQEADEGRVNLR